MTFVPHKWVWVYAAANLYAESIGLPKMYNLIFKKNNQEKTKKWRNQAHITYRHLVDHNQPTDRFRDSLRYVPCRSVWSRRPCNNSRAPGRAGRKLRCRGTRTACKRSLSSFSSPSPSQSPDLSRSVVVPLAFSPWNVLLYMKTHDRIICRARLRGSLSLRGIARNVVASQTQTRITSRVLPWHVMKCAIVYDDESLALA